MKKEATLGDGTTRKDLENQIEELRGEIESFRCQLAELSEDDEDYEYLSQALEDDIYRCEEEIETAEYGIHHIDCLEEADD